MVSAEGGCRATHTHSFHFRENRSPPWASKCLCTPYRSPRGIPTTPKQRGDGRWATGLEKSKAAQSVFFVFAAGGTTRQTCFCCKQTHKRMKEQQYPRRPGKSPCALPIDLETEIKTKVRQRTNERERGRDSESRPLEWL